jgi:hypothetical protein
MQDMMKKLGKGGGGMPGGMDDLLGGGGMGGMGRAWAPAVGGGLASRAASPAAGAAAAFPGSRVVAGGEFARTTRRHGKGLASRSRRLLCFSPLSPLLMYGDRSPWQSRFV